MIEKLRRDQHHRQRLPHGGFHGFQLRLYQLVDLGKAVHLLLRGRPTKGPRGKTLNDFPDVGFGILLTQGRFEEDAHVRLRRPDIGDGRLELHPVDYHARHSEVAVAIVERAIVVQDLRRDDPAVRLLLAANDSPTRERKVLNAPAKLIHFRLVDAVHHVCATHWFHALGGAVELNGLAHNQP